jgi:erythromycin esterase-like protein
LLALMVITALAAASTALAAEDELGPVLRALSQPLNDADDLRPLIDASRRARVVLLGEASHGTHEFQLWRDRLSRRLVEEQDVQFIAIEGEWASLLPLDRYVRHRVDAPASAQAALQEITRWPRWVWANSELVAFGEWLRRHNAGLPPARRIGIHGIDTYAIRESIDAVLAFHDAHLPWLSDWVRRQYRRLLAFRGDDLAYTESVRLSGQSAAAGVARVAAALHARYRRARPSQRELLIEPLQHARVVESGERYLRLLPGPPYLSWNARSAHFAATLDRLLEHYGSGSRAIVWAHNTHVGDARATDISRTGEVSLGQIARQRHGHDGVFIVGFSTAQGSVLAARRWGGAVEEMATPAPRSDSLEAALLTAGVGDSFMLFTGERQTLAPLRGTRPHRAIGVVFVPGEESQQNYVPTRVVQRYNALLFLPHTRALDALPMP